jgi:hypothetical protein
MLLAKSERLVNRDGGDINTELVGEVGARSHLDRPEEITSLV